MDEFGQLWLIFLELRKGKFLVPSFLKKEPKGCKDKGLRHEKIWDENGKTNVSPFHLPSRADETIETFSREEVRREFLEVREEMKWEFMFACILGFCCAQLNFSLVEIESHEWKNGDAYVWKSLKHRKWGKFQDPDWNSEIELGGTINRSQNKKLEH